MHLHDNYQRLRDARKRKSNRKVGPAPRGVGDPFVDMNGGTEAFFGRAGDTPRVACDGLDGLGAAGPAYTMSVRIIANQNSVSDEA
jgi:hypothetical protein